MSMMVNVFNPSLALLTDLYQLTMAYGYWKSGMADREAVFHLSFRKAPFDGQYAIACGLASVIDYIKKLQFGDGDLAYLAQLPGNDGKPMFDRAFLVHMRRMRFTLDVDAIPEGTVVFANEPLVRVKGPLLQAQIVETALLNMINFQTLIATKSSRVCQAAQGDPVIEFGLRRAQGIDGAISATRAAYVGGCAATSNVLAGKVFNIPVRGTHAHSWVMSFESELEAFEAYAKALPNNCIFLVDTYDTIEGVRHAIAVGKSMRQRGHEMVGIRLDSGDLAYLSIEARKMLDAAGFPKAKILASNDLDEHLIADLKQQGATIGLWGVGTKLVTAFDQPALGGVYKLSAIRDAESRWRHKVKRSEQLAKASVPGILQVRRFKEGDAFAADAIYDEITGIDAERVTVIDPLDMTRRKMIDKGTPHEDLLVPVFRAGKCVYEQPPLAQTRQRALDQIAALHPAVRRFKNPHSYPAGLERRLFELRNTLIMGRTELHDDHEMTSVSMEDTAVAMPAVTTQEEVAPEPQPEPVAEAPPTPQQQPTPPPPVHEEPKAEPKPQVSIPPRPKFAGIGAKHGQAPTGSTVKVNVKRAAARPNPFFGRGNQK